MEDGQQHQDSELAILDKSSMEVESPAKSGGATITVSDESVLSDLTKDSSGKKDEEEKEGEGPTNMDIEPQGADPVEDTTNAMQVDGADVLAVQGETTLELGEDSGDLLNAKKLYELLDQSKSAGDLIAGKNVLLLIGGTGAGKTTTTLYLSGVKFELVDVDGLDHYEPQDLPPSLSEFAVSGGATSVTKTIHATTVTLPTGETVTICDTPGFGDTKGTEMEISNGLGVIHALKRAASVKPVLVIDAEGMSKDRYSPLRKTLGTVIDMMGHCTDFSAFQYVFTRCTGKKIKKVHKQLAAFQKKLRENANDIIGDNIEIKDVLDAMLSDMVMKTNPEATVIDPEEGDEEKETLTKLWSGPRLGHPSEAFVDFISQDAYGKLDRQVNRMLLRLEIL